MQIERNASLKAYNTFGIDVNATGFISVETVDELKQALTSQDFDRKFILGGGSNMLLLNDVDALVIHIGLRGIETVKEDENHIWLKVAGGENWHALVQFCVERNYGGIENLSLIPGNTGTAPIQNIGAYGVELQDTLESCTTIHRSDLTEKVFANAECEFGYRESVFKRKYKDEYIITHVTFKLTKKNHQLHTGYGAIQQKLEERGIASPTIKDISEAVIAIRSEKLPDPKLLGNSGSFFKNPIISRIDFEKLQLNHPYIPSYPVDENLVKVPAGWLIEQAGLKGKRFGHAGIHKNQALVLVNYGSATGKEIWNIAEKVQETVMEIFGIELTPEVNVIN
ncbi:MAG: UDP-N-acetylmuramate dehydrogenase [Leeuwenhoekiella sp.]